MRRPVLVLALLLCCVALSACQQARCAWQNAQDCVCERLPSPCCPDECGVTWTEPVYDPVCASQPFCGSCP